MSVTIKVNDIQSFTAYTDSASSRQVNCTPLNLGEQVQLQLSSTTVPTKNVRLKTLTKTIDISDNFDVTENCIHTIIVTLLDGSAASFIFPVQIPFTLATVEHTLCPVKSCYEVNIKMIGTSPLVLDEVVLHPSQMFNVHDSSILYVGYKLHSNDVWQCAFELTHKATSIDGKSIVTKTPDIGRVELKWKNNGRPGKLQTAPLKRKEVEAVACWPSVDCLRRDDLEQDVGINVQNNCEEPINNVFIRFDIENLHCQNIIPDGAVAFQIDSLSPGERVAFMYRLVLMTRDIDSVDCVIRLQYRISSVEHNQPRDFIFKVAEI